MTGESCAARADVVAVAASTPPLGDIDALEAIGAAGPDAGTAMPAAVETTTSALATMLAGDAAVGSAATAIAIAWGAVAVATGGGTYAVAGDAALIAGVAARDDSMGVVGAVDGATRVLGGASGGMTAMTVAGRPISMVGDGEAPGRVSATSRSRSRPVIEGVTGALVSTNGLVASSTGSTGADRAVVVAAAADDDGRVTRAARD